MIELIGFGLACLAIGIFTFFKSRIWVKKRANERTLVNAAAFTLGGLAATLLFLLGSIVYLERFGAVGEAPSSDESREFGHLPRGYPPPPHSEPAFAKLLGASREMEGFGLYSYLLLGSAPKNYDERERDLSAIVSISSMPTFEHMRAYFSRRTLNITYLPLRLDVEMKSTPTDIKTAELMLGEYNFARARSMLDVINPALRRGPYIISVLQPLDAKSGLQQSYLFQDLGSATPRVVKEWVALFTIESAKEDFWDPEEVQRLALTLRSDIDLMAHDVMPNMPSKLAELIGWQARSPDKVP